MQGTHLLGRTGGGIDIGTTVGMAGGIPGLQRYRLMLPTWTAANGHRVTRTCYLLVAPVAATEHDVQGLSKGAPEASRAFPSAAPAMA